MAKKILKWTPRTIAILAILFMMMFSLDCFGENPVIKDQLICLFMHNIPAYVCVIVLIIAWRWQLIGGLIFIVFFITAGIFFKTFAGNPYSLIVIGPFLITGILFILDHYFARRRNQ